MLSTEKELPRLSTEPTLPILAKLKTHPTLSSPKRQPALNADNTLHLDHHVRYLKSKPPPTTPPRRNGVYMTAEATTSRHPPLIHPATPPRKIHSSLNSQQQTHRKAISPVQ